MRQRALFLVEGSAGRDTAICIFPRGIFITSAHCVARQKKVRLLASLPMESGNSFDALVWHVDVARDLAVLVPEKPLPANFSALLPGDISDLAVKDHVTFFGFSLTKLNPDNPRVPVVESAGASVVSLPDEKNTLAVIRVLADAPTIKSGGPLLDSDGRLIGIMRIVQKMGSNPSAALSIREILALLMPKISVKLTTTHSGKFGPTRQAFIALETIESLANLQAVSPLESKPFYTIEMAIGNGKIWRPCPVTRVGENQFSATEIDSMGMGKTFYQIKVRRDGLSLGTVVGTLETAPPITLAPSGTLDINSAAIPLVPVP